MTGYRLVKRAEAGAGCIMAVRINEGRSDAWSNDPHDERAIILDELSAEDAAATWNDYAATKGYGWRVIAEPA